MTERILPLAGYGESRSVRVGNAAAANYEVWVRSHVFHPEV